MWNSSSVPSSISSSPPLLAQMSWLVWVILFANILHSRIEVMEPFCKYNHHSNTALLLCYWMECSKSCFFCSSDSTLWPLTSGFFQATVLEEMPPFPERESSILAKLKKKKGPGAVSVTELEDSKREGGELNGGSERGPETAAVAASNAVNQLCFFVAYFTQLQLQDCILQNCNCVVFSSQLLHHQQTSSAFVPLLPLVVLQPLLAACWWMCSLRLHRPCHPLL